MIINFIHRRIPAIVLSFIIIAGLVTSIFLSLPVSESTPPASPSGDYPEEGNTDNSEPASHATLNKLFSQKESPPKRTYGSLTQTPLSDSGTASVDSEDEEIEDRSVVYTTPTGDLTSIELWDLLADTTYHITLSNYNCMSIAIAWTDGDIEYSFSDDTETELNALQPSDDIQPFETMLTSPLLECPSTEVKILTLLPHSTVKTVRIDLFLEEFLAAMKPKISQIQSQSLSSIINYNSGASYTALPIISRDQWGANTYTWDPYSNTDIDDPARFVWSPTYHRTSRIVVHHTATTNNPSDPIAAVRQIYLYHTYSRGWGDIGYNYLIDQYGNIYEGKAGGDGVYGYHASTEANAMSVGISLLGDFTSISPTAAAQNSLASLIAEKATFFGFDLKYSDGSYWQWLDTSYTVFGHRDSWFWCYPGHIYFDNPYICASQVGWAQNSTSCPGNTLRSILPTTIVPRAQQIMNTTYHTLDQLSTEVHENMQFSHYKDVIVVGFNLPENVSESQVLSLIPSFSGISDVTVEKNKAYIRVLDWENGGTNVPPAGWSGYNADGTFFPPSAGTDDQLENLIKVFRLSPNVTFAETIGTRELY